jgi:hypothetical protein
MSHNTWATILGTLSTSPGCEVKLARHKTPKPPRGPHAEVQALIERLLDHAERLAWGSGSEPGVGGWYLIGGKDTGVWEMYAGGGPPNGQASLTIAMNRIRARLGDEVIFDLAASLEKIPAYSEPVKLWRTTPSRQPSGKLQTIATDPISEAALIAALELVIDRSDIAST